MGGRAVTGVVHNNKYISSCAILRWSAAVIIVSEFDWKRYRSPFESPQQCNGWYVSINMVTGTLLLRKYLQVAVVTITHNSGPFSSEQ